MQQQKSSTKAPPRTKFFYTTLSYVHVHINMYLPLTAELYSHAQPHIYTQTCMHIKHRWQNLYKHWYVQILHKLNTFSTHSKYTVKFTYTHTDLHNHNQRIWHHEHMYSHTQNFHTTHAQTQSKKLSTLIHTYKIPHHFTTTEYCNPYTDIYSHLLQNLYSTHTYPSTHPPTHPTMELIAQSPDLTHGSNG